MTITKTYIDPFRAITRLHSQCLFGLLLANIPIQHTCIRRPFLNFTPCRLKDTVKSSSL